MSTYQWPVWFSIPNGLKIRIKMLELTPIAKSHKTFFREKFGLGNGVYKRPDNFIIRNTNKRQDSCLDLLSGDIALFKSKKFGRKQKKDSNYGRSYKQFILESIPIIVQKIVA